MKGRAGKDHGSLWKGGMQCQRPSPQDTFPGPLAPWEDGGGGFFSFIFEALVPDSQ